MMKKLIIIFVILCIAGLLSLAVLKYRPAFISYLEKSEKIQAGMLIMEGWLPDRALEIVKNEITSGNYDHVVSSGIYSDDLDFCMVAMNGYLIFYPRLADKPESEIDSHQIELLAHSKMGGKYCANFRIYVNDSLISEFNADEKPRKYSVMWKKPLHDIDSVMVQFTNDYVDKDGDRNLYVKEIIIDNRIVVPYQFNSVQDNGVLGGNNRTLNNYTSNPEIIRNKLIAWGIDSSRVTAVTGRRTSLNRTLVSALAFRRWLRASGSDVKTINVVSVSIHARRTWLTYKTVLGRHYKVGIIPLPDSVVQPSEMDTGLNVITELIDLIYYRIILIPYLILC